MGRAAAFDFVADLPFALTALRLAAGWRAALVAPFPVLLAALRVAAPRAGRRVLPFAFCAFFHSRTRARWS